MIVARQFVKPIVVVSQCLEFEACRYNGAVIPAKFIDRLKKHVHFLPICPEVEIGLGIPRDPVKLIEHNKELTLFQPATGRDLTASINRFSRSFLDSLKEVDGFILKFASPSCGIKDAKVFLSPENPIAVRKGPGMFARAVLERFDGLAIEDEGRLNNFRIREHFLTKLFLLADFRQVKKQQKIAALVNFHSRHKLLLMAYSQKHLRLMGKLVANDQKKNLKDILQEYEILLKEALMRAAKFTSHINVLMHAMGYFKNDVSPKEKKYFLDLMNKYRKEILPLSSVLTVLHSWVVKFDQEYLLDQTYFEPYPEELIEITDSGSGRNTRY